MPASPPKQPKSILKKTAPLQSGFSQLPSPTSESSNQNQNRDRVAAALLPVSIPDLASLPTEQRLAHEQALLLQRLSQTELKPAVPLETIELLSSFPSLRNPAHKHPVNNLPLTAANPSPSDASEFLRLVADFTPTEYLELIEERNCLGNCGYVLCPRPKRNYEGEYKIIMRTGNIARTEDLNKWCSDECAVRALYVKVQLDNPSYVTDLETGRRVVKVELREEKQKPVAAEKTKGAGGGERGKEEGKAKATRSKEAEEQLASDLARLDLNRKTEISDKAAQMQRDADALAVERGQGGGKLDRLLAGQGVEVTIREKPTTGPAKAPDQTKASSTTGKKRPEDAHHMVEGHKPTFGTGAKKQGAAKKDGSASESDGSEDDDINDYLAQRIQVVL